MMNNPIPTMICGCGGGMFYFRINGEDLDSVCLKCYHVVNLKPAGKLPKHLIHELEEMQRTSVPSPAHKPKESDPFDDFCYQCDQGD